MSPPPLQLSFPARAEYLVLARLCLAGLAHVVPVDAETLADLKLAVSEACTNAVRHAYPEGHAADVRLRIETADGRLVIVVEDDGRGFESTSTDGPGEPTESGMGLAIIQAVVDELSIGSGTGGKGTVVRMSKRLVESPPSIDTAVD